MQETDFATCYTNIESMQEVYSDCEFRRNAEKMLRKQYVKAKKFLKEQAIDLEDFIQEAWTRLFEANTFNTDRALCMLTLQCRAKVIVRDSKRRDEIAPQMPKGDEMEEFLESLADDRVRFYDLDNDLDNDLEKQLTKLVNSATENK
jgi:hypothetical protein